MSMKQNDELYHKKESITLSIERDNDKLILRNGKGQKWTFSKNVGSTSAMATLVYSTILHNNDFVEGFCSRYKISLEIQELE